MGRVTVPDGETFEKYSPLQSLVSPRHRVQRVQRLVCLDVKHGAGRRINIPFTSESCGSEAYLLLFRRIRHPGAAERDGRSGSWALPFLALIDNGRRPKTVDGIISKHETQDKIELHLVAVK